MTAEIRELVPAGLARNKRLGSRCNSSEQHAQVRLLEVMQEQ